MIILRELSLDDLVKLPNDKLYYIIKYPLMIPVNISHINISSKNDIIIEIQLTDMISKEKIIKIVFDEDVTLFETLEEGNKKLCELLQMKDYNDNKLYLNYKDELIKMYKTLYPEEFI